MIGMYRGFSMVSRVIEFRTWSPYSHVSEINDATAEVVEAWHVDGVALRENYHEAHKQGTIIELYDVEGITPEQRHDVWMFLRGQVGKGYDFGGIYGFIRRGDRQSYDKWFCSELEFTAYLRVMICLLERIEPHKVYPGLIPLSPRLKYVGYLVVGEDMELLGRVPVSEIARLRASERPQNGSGGICAPAGGRKSKCKPLPEFCRPYPFSAGPSILPILNTAGGITA